MSTAATTSPLDSIPAETRARLPDTTPVPSFRATSPPAASIDINAVPAAGEPAGGGAIAASLGPGLTAIGETIGRTLVRRDRNTACGQANPGPDGVARPQHRLRPGDSGPDGVARPTDAERSEAPY